MGIRSLIPLKKVEVLFYFIYVILCRLTLIILVTIKLLTKKKLILKSENLILSRDRTMEIRIKKEKF